jgi:hypothetical protein
MAPAYIRQSATEQSSAHSAERDAVAILVMAPLAAAVSGSPAPSSDTEHLCARLVVTSRNGSVCMRVIFGPKPVVAAPAPAISAQFADLSRMVAQAAGNSPAVEFATSVA